MPLMISKLSNAHEIEVSNKTITQEWPYIDWPHRDGVCILWLFFDMVACTASIWNLVIIAFDRFLVRYVSIYNDRHHTHKICNIIQYHYKFYILLQAVQVPIKYMALRRRSAVLMIFIAWFVGVFLISPVFVQQIIDQSAIHFTYCSMEDPDKIMPGLNLASVIVYFYFPLLIIVVCYVWIFVKIKQKVDQKVAARLEQLEMITCSAQLTNQVI